MPYAAPSRCTRNGCRALAVHDGRCQDHPRPPRPGRRPSKSWTAGSTRRWRKVRAAHLADEPDCRSCGVEAEEVDHIIPLGLGGSMWDPANHQSLCTPCHEAKTRRDRRDIAAARARARVS